MIVALLKVNQISDDIPFRSREVEPAVESQGKKDEDAAQDNTKKQRPDPTKKVMMTKVRFERTRLATPRS